MIFRGGNKADMKRIIRNTFRVLLLAAVAALVTVVRPISADASVSGIHSAEARQSLMDFEIKTTDGRILRVSDLHEDYIAFVFGRTSCSRTGAMMDTLDCAQAKGLSINKVFVTIDNADDKLSVYSQWHPGTITIAAPGYSNNYLRSRLSSIEGTNTSGNEGLPDVFVLDKGRNLVWSSAGEYTTEFCRFWNLTVAQSFSIGFQDNKSEYRYVGDTFQLAAYYSPAGVPVASRDWRSSDEDVIKVDANGKCTAVGTGSALILCDSTHPSISPDSPGKVGYINLSFLNVYVSPRPSSGGNTGSGSGNSSTPQKTISVKSVKLSVPKTKLYVGDTEKISATVTPSNATNKTVTFTSSDTSVITVKKGKNNTATLTAKKAGSAWVKANAGEASYSVYITVNKKATVKAPAVPKLSSVKKGKKSFVAAWKKVSGAKGYQIQYSTSKKFTKSTTKTKTISKASTLKTTVKSLKSKRTYYVRIRAYKTSASTKVYSKWSSAKSVKTK